ncbi:MAG: GNAT family N-acetyltransferase [Archangiaceae bacterium]|nr:GNAT family N-acetyltransferase [Archangiaceae bacterium]
MSFEVRWAQERDAEHLSAFFAKAYGAQSVLTDLGFLRWYLGSSDGFNSVIAVERAGDVVAHYGALRVPFRLADATVELWWGVNAFTLPSHRGRGLGQEVVAPIMERAELFGVIGFSPQTANFYEREGFNLFSRRRFSRYARVLREETFGLAPLYAESSDRVRARLPLRPWSTEEELPRDGRLMRGTTDVPGVIATTLRRQDYLQHRFSHAPAPRYQMFTSSSGDAFVCFRVARLFPTGLSSLNVVDASGSVEAVRELLRRVLSAAAHLRCAYVDFVAWGGPYGDVMRDLQFETLEEDEVGLLPLLTSPIAPRDNHEYLGLYSRAHHGAVHRLNSSDVYLTRADSDRDRAARLSDLAAVNA